MPVHTRNSSTNTFSLLQTAVLPDKGIFLIQPLSAVFYPVDVLPSWLQRIAYLLPSTHVFEGMRAVLATGTVDPSRIGIALLLSLVNLAMGGAFFGWSLRVVREKGYLSRLGME